MTEWLHLLALLLYGVGAAFMGYSFARGGRGMPRSAAVAVTLALAVHAAALAAFTSRWGELPLVGLGPSLSTLGFIIALGALAAAIPSRAGTVATSAARTSAGSSAVPASSWARYRAVTVVRRGRVVGDGDLLSR